MEWLVLAHQEITERPVPRLTIRYSARFRGFNANVRYGRGWMEFRLARRWQAVDDEIKQGLVQHLLCKVYGERKRTLSIELYEEFLRQASEYAPPGESDPYLVERFDHVNGLLFDGMLSMPTLEWGSFSTTKLGSYEYATDTVRLSTALRDDEDMLDYVLYHELLHKKHKFTCTGGRTHHHTAAFRKDEAKFPIADAEGRLNRYIAQQRRKKPAKKRSRWLPW